MVNEEGLMYHIHLKKGDIGRYVLLPGDPFRTDLIATYFDEPKLIAHNREHKTWVGKLDGVPVAGTYHTVEQNPQGVGDVLKAAFSGFYDAVDVCVFILMVGGFLGVVMKTGAIDAGVSNVIALLGGREKWLIPILMLFFGLGGTTYGMWEETMAFFPLLLPIFLAAGYDAVVGVAVILLGAGAGVIASTVNPFATGIAAGFAGVSLGEGLLWRLIQFVIFEGAAIWYVSAYAARVKRDPICSVVGIGAGRLHADVGRVQPLTRRHAAILLIFAATFLTMIYGVIPFDEMGLPLPVLGWWFPELSALFLVAGIVVGLMDRLSEVELAETFVSGCTDLLGVAFIIGISRGITVLMNDGHITDTILHWGETALSGLGSTSFVLLAPCEVGVMLTQTAGEYEQKLQEKDLVLFTSQPEQPIKIMADGRRLWRVFDNLIKCLQVCPALHPRLSDAGGEKRRGNHLL